jgi:hypothetical protein
MTAQKQKRIEAARNRSSFSHHQWTRSEPKIEEQRPTNVGRVALLTGGGDKPYALGLAAALTSHGLWLDFIGSDDHEVPELLNDRRVTFLNLRGDQDSEASPIAKVLRVLRYYHRLVRYG